MDYELRLVEYDPVTPTWTVVETMSLPVFQQPVTEALNGQGMTAIQVSPNDPDHAAFYAELATDWPAREVQLWRDGDTEPLWWGVPTDPSKQLASDVLTVVLAESIPWWLSGLYFGKAQRENLLDDPNFESGAFAPEWIGVGDIDTATVDTAEGLLNHTSAVLTHAAVEDVSVQQWFAFTAGGVGDNISVAAWCMVVSSTSGKSFENRGLFAEWRDAGNVVRQTASVPINFDRVGEWQRLEIPLGRLWVPPNESVTINVRGYTTDGTIRWGAFFCGLMESFSWLTYAGAGDTGADLASLLAGMVNHSQDVAFDKVDLGIGTGGAATGGLYAFVRQFAEHANIWSNGVMDLVNRQEGIDVGYVYTATSRVLQSYSRVGAATGKGTDRTALDLTPGGALVLDVGWRKPAGQAATSVVQLGAGEGPDREEAGWVDLAALAGRVREHIASAPIDATIDDLDERAERVGRIKNQPREVYVAFRPGVGVSGAGKYATGDRFTLPALSGGHIAGGTYRLIQRSLNPRTDSIVATLQPVP